MGDLLVRHSRTRSIGCPSNVEFNIDFDLQASLTSKSMSNSTPSELLHKIIHKFFYEVKSFPRPGRDKSALQKGWYKIWYTGMESPRARQKDRRDKRIQAPYPGVPGATR